MKKLIFLTMLLLTIKNLQATGGNGIICRNLVDGDTNELINDKVVLSINPNIGKNFFNEENKTITYSVQSILDTLKINEDLNYITISNEFTNNEIKLKWGAGNEHITIELSYNYWKKFCDNKRLIILTVTID